MKLKHKLAATLRHIAYELDPNCWRCGHPQSNHNYGCKKFTRLTKEYITEMRLKLGKL